MNFFDMNSEVCNLRAEDEPSLASFTCTCIPAGRPWSVWLRRRGRIQPNRRSSPWIQDNGRSLPACPSPCGSARDAERGRGAGRRASRQRSPVDPLPNAWGRGEASPLRRSITKASRVIDPG
jgi:hypothetical protein